MVALASFLRAVTGNAPGWIEIRCLPEPRKDGVYARSEWFVSAEQAATWAETCGARLNAESHGLFFGVARRVAPAPRGHGGKDTDVTRCWSLWADLDWKGYAGGKDEATERLRSVAPAPSIIVCSGGGFHAYWRLGQPLPAAVARSLNQRLALALASDTSVVNPARVLRLPGLNHRKNPEKIRPVEVVGWQSVKYAEHAFNALPRLPKPPKPQPLPLPVLRSPGRARRYAEAALTKTCDRLRQATNGQRHHDLFVAACSLGRFVGAGLLSRADTATWLLSAIAAAGAENLHNAANTIEDGFQRGEREPLELRG